MILGLLAPMLVFAQAEFTVRVEGEGYLRFLKDGRAVYARSAAVVVQNGELREKSGPGFLPPLRVSAANASLEIGADGVVQFSQTRIGRLVLARFEEGAAFEPIGPFVLARDRADLGFAGENGFGSIRTRGAENAGMAAPPKTPISSAQTERQSGRSPGIAEGSLTITIPPTVDVEGPRFTLGQIAKIEGDSNGELGQIDLGAAPVHGVPQTYSRDRLLGRLTPYRLDRRSLRIDMPPTVQIVRKGQVVTGAQLVETARKALEEKLGLKGDLDSADRLADLSVPFGKLEIVAESTSLSGGTATVGLAVKVEGKRVAGRLVRLAGPSLEPAVRLGASVTVRFLSGGVAVELPGKARSAGAVGQEIEVTVITPETRETTLHRAVVKGPGVVEVKL